MFYVDLLDLYHDFTINSLSTNDLTINSLASLSVSMLSRVKYNNKFMASISTWVGSLSADWTVNAVR